MAREYKRPSAAFFLLRPVPERDLPPDFRRLPDAEALTSKTRFAIRKAQYLQEISSELMDNLNRKTDMDVNRANLKDDPERRANFERERTGISPDEQKKWEKPSEALNHWREYIQQRNILVFQFSMNVEELRGLALTDLKPFVIVVSSSDSIKARIFSLLHEYGHILLHKPALCIPDKPTVEKYGQAIERWCNHFAAAFLLPAESVKKDFAELEARNYKHLASMYEVSYRAMLIRLLELGLMSNHEFKQEWRKLKKPRQKVGGGGGENLAEKAVRERGSAFVSLVLENTQQGHINYNDALDYLDVKTKHLQKLTGSTP
jgi:Zn-dependent peptidase ImmA (M78 family)